MTQAFNLAQFANNLNSSGATSNTGLQNSTISGTSLGSNLPALTISTGLGGSSYNGTSAVTITNTGVTSAVAGTGITVSGATGAVTISSTATGTVTSVATGNGLSGGTITSTGTLVVACPTYNTVGSYAFIGGSFNQVFAPATSFSAGTGTNQVQPATLFFSSCQMSPLLGSTYGYSLSGTWRAMTFNAPGSSFFVGCRVS